MFGRWFSLTPCAIEFLKATHGMSDCFRWRCHGFCADPRFLTLPLSLTISMHSLQLYIHIVRAPAGIVLPIFLRWTSVDSTLIKTHHAKSCFWGMWDVSIVSGLHNKVLDDHNDTSFQWRLRSPIWHAVWQAPDVTESESSEAEVEPNAISPSQLGLMMVGWNSSWELEAKLTETGILWDPYLGGWSKQQMFLCMVLLREFPL